MAGRNVKRLYDLEIDEVSLVDRSANQHADVAIAKRDEDTMSKLIDADGRVVSEDQMVAGTPYWDADTGEFAGIACEEGAEPEDYGFTLDDNDEVVFEAVNDLSELEDDEVDEGQLAAVGKSLGASVYEELSKALNDDARDQVVSKALAAAETRARAAEHRAAQAITVAKGLQEQLVTERLTEHVSGYGIPGAPNDLVEILKSLDPAKAQVLDRVLSSVGEQLYAEVGTGGGEQDSTTLGQIEAMSKSVVTKSDVSAEQAMTEIFAANPDAYDAYLAEMA